LAISTQLEKTVEAQKTAARNIPWCPLFSPHLQFGGVSLIWHERSHGHAGQRWIRDLIVELTAGTR